MVYPGSLSDNYCPSDWIVQNNQLQRQHTGLSVLLISCQYHTKHFLDEWSVSLVVASDVNAQNLLGFKLSSEQKGGFLVDVILGACVDVHVIRILSVIRKLAGALGSQAF